MIDTGSSASAETLLAMLDHYGIRSIDLIVLTHADGDHSGGLDRLLETLPVSEVMMTERTYSTLAESYEGNALETATSEGSITLSVVSAGYVTTIGNVELKVLSPSAADESLFADENEASLVLLLRYGETEAIFPGDAGFEGEAHALDYLKRFLPDLSCEILLVGHHGSASSSSENFLSFLRPEYAVISCGKDNLYGHPTITVLDRLTAIGAEIYRTDTDGTVLLHSDGKNIVRLK